MFECNSGRALSQVNLSCGGNTAVAKGAVCASSEASQDTKIGEVEGEARGGLVVTEEEEDVEDEV